MIDADEATFRQNFVLAVLVLNVCRPRESRADPVVAKSAAHRSENLIKSN